MSDRTTRFQSLLPISLLKDHPVSVIGVGAIGRQVALQLATMGVVHIQLWDDDVVSEANLGTQGWLEEDVGRPKVEVAMCELTRLSTTCEAGDVCRKFSVDKALGISGRAVFCCVDSMAAREQVWLAAKNEATFFVDGRMGAENARIISMPLRDPVHDHDLDPDHRLYDDTWFPDEEAELAPCTERSTFYCASIAAGMMVHQYTRYLRGERDFTDTLVNLNAGIMVAKRPQSSPS